MHTRQGPLKGSCSLACHACVGMTSSEVCSSRRPLGACVVVGAGVALGVALGPSARALVGPGVALGTAAFVPAGGALTVLDGAGAAVLGGSGGMAAVTDASGTAAALATAAIYLWCTARSVLQHSSQDSFTASQTEVGTAPCVKQALQAQLCGIPQPTAAAQCVYQ